MECTKHTGETVIMVCKSCVKYPLLCGVCIEEDHTEHKLQTLRNAALSIRQHFEQVETDKLDVFKEIKSDLVNISKLREECHQESSRVGEEIVKHVDVIKGEVDKVNKEVEEKRKTEFDRNMASIDETEQALTQQVSRIEMFQKKVAEIQKMNDYVEVIVAGRDTEVPDTARVPRPDIHRLQFQTGNVNAWQLERMFGTVAGTCDGKTEKGEEKANTSSDFVGSIKRELNVNISSVNSFSHSQTHGLAYMFCHDSELCFLKCSARNSVKLSDSSGQIKQSINLGTTTNGFTVTKDNRLLFCCTHQNCVKEMQLPNGEITEKIDTSPLTPKCICTGPYGDIYVTLCDNTEYEVTESSTRALARYGKRGREKTRRQNDAYGNNIFVLPLEVCVNSANTQIAVINDINRRRSELVLFDGQLSPELIYRGPSVLTGDTMEGFELAGVMFDSRDNILVAEAFSRTVQLLSPSCEPLKTLLVTDASPRALALHDDKVWVGDHKGNVRIFRYSY
ncbi:uncharacterized protein PF3D7_1120000-like [Argopecten irradians]|uniref:uncharacterized protein PF3D7_1120000-like n=1 Tax=Argopecten irradians TaxID=31199 RepID=UPI003721C815